MDALRNTKSLVDSRITQLLSNEIILTVLKVVLVLYASRIAPNPPAFLSRFVESTVGKIVLITLVALVTKIDIGLAIIIAMGLVLTMNALSGRGILESFENFPGSFVKDTEFKGKLLEPKTMIHFGCLDMKAKDLLDAFVDTDLQKTVQYAFNEVLKKTKGQEDKMRVMALARMAGLPYNITLTDENAPYIATILVQWGYDFGGKCNNKK